MGQAAFNMYEKIQNLFQTTLDWITSNAQYVAILLMLAYCVFVFCMIIIGFCYNAVKHGLKSKEARYAMTALIIDLVDRYFVSVLKKVGLWKKDKEQVATATGFNLNVNLNTNAQNAGDEEDLIIEQNFQEANEDSQLYYNEYLP